MSTMGVSTRLSISDMDTTPCSAHCASGHEMSYAPSRISNMTYDFMHSKQYRHWQVPRHVVSVSGTSIRHSLHSTYSSGAGRAGGAGWGACASAAWGLSEPCEHGGEGEEVLEGESGAKDAALACSEYRDDEASERMLEHREHTREVDVAPDRRSLLTGRTGCRGCRAAGSESRPVVRHLRSGGPWPGPGSTADAVEVRGRARSLRNWSTL